MTDPTLEYYDSDPEGFFDRTFGSDMSDSRARFLAHLEPGARILDLGCGSCRDTLAFRGAGYDAVPADASEGMRRLARERLGLEVLPLSFGDLAFDGEFDGVWACASLLHVPSAELPGVLGRVRASLKPGGAFFCCFKEGEFEGVRDGRFYTDMTVEALAALLEGCGFQVAEAWASEGARDSWANAVSVRGRSAVSCECLPIDLLS